MGKVVNIDTSEIKKTITWISSISDSEEKEGTTRLLYSKSWEKAQNELKKKFESIGMNSHFDSVGNLYGTIQGEKNENETIATGSHVDTVENGGKLDGQLGIISGYLAVKKLLEIYGKPKKNIQIISMAEEEGSRFPYAFWGSSNIFGIANNNDVKNITDKNGINFVEAMNNCGFDFQKNFKKREDIKAFIELHIEQGNFLENENITIGAVEGIVGQKRYDITLVGQSNHAGTTLMKYRKDTVACMAKIIDESIQMANDVGDPLVLTFGKVEVEPNVVNVVPGKVVFTMDCRHSNEKELEDFTDKLENNMKKIAKSMDIKININNWMNEKPTFMDKKIVELVESTCKNNGIKYRRMTSGAGHDSQIFAKYVPTGMIFIPSIDGISHNPKEDTNIEDIKQGIEILAEVIYKLAY